MSIEVQVLPGPLLAAKGAEVKVFHAATDQNIFDALFSLTESASHVKYMLQSEIMLKIPGWKQWRAVSMVDERFSIMSANCNMVQVIKPLVEFCNNHDVAYVTSGCPEVMDLAFWMSVGFKQ